jgi:hypothetical protein
MQVSAGAGAVIAPQPATAETAAPASAGPATTAYNSSAIDAAARAAPPGSTAT